MRAGRITLNRWVQLNSTGPARLFGLAGKKGTLAPGADGDVVIWDPEKKHTITVKTQHSKSDYNPYEGREMVGKPSHVFSRGKLVVEGDQFLGKKGAGSFIKRGTTLA